MKESSIVFAFFYAQGTRRWLAAWTVSFIAHGICPLVFWGFRLQVVKSSSPTARTIVLRLLPSRVRQASGSQDVVLSFASEDFHTFTEKLPKRESRQEKKKSSSTEPKSIDVVKKTFSKTVAAARLKSGTASLSASIIEVRAADKTEPSSSLENTEKSLVTDAANLAGREDTPLSGVLTSEEGAPLPVSQTSEPPGVDRTSCSVLS